MSGFDAFEACEDYDADMDSCAWSRREAARIKQIQIGKARPEYQRYLREVPQHRRNASQPGTPDPRARVSKRQFDRALGDWRRRLHEFDAVPRSAPRQAEFEDQWSSSGQQSAKDAWGSSSKKLSGAGDLDQIEGSGRAGARSANRRARATPVLPPRERSGKFGPRKPVDSPIKEQLALPDPPPPPPPLTVPSSGVCAQSSQHNAVRISLADQLTMENPMQQAALSMPAEWQWQYGGEAVWGMVETPQKNMFDMQFMPMETPPDASQKMSMMSGQAMCQPLYDENGMMKVDDPYLGMPVESYMHMIPNRLFEMTPEKSDPSALLEIEGTTAAVESGDSPSSAGPERAEPASPRCRPQEDEDSVMPLMSPQPQMSPLSLRGLTTPTPATPKRPCYVPDTPSPDRNHYTNSNNPWAHATMPYMQPTPGITNNLLGGMPWHYGLQATDQVMPEFLHMMQSTMPCMAHEGQPSA